MLDKLTTRQPALKAASEGSAPLTGQDEKAAACIVAILKRYVQVQNIFIYLTRFFRFPSPILLAP